MATQKEVLILKASGKIKKVNGTIDIKFIQKVVGGYFEIISQYKDGKHFWLYMNEDGRLINLPVNKKASELAGVQIVGDVILEHRKNI
jgi:hypothetical protein